MASDLLREGAYIQHQGKLYRMVSQERSSEGFFTGRWLLEDARDLRVVSVGVADLNKSAELVKPAPAELPAHLDKQMDEHLQDVGLARDRAV